MQKVTRYFLLFVGLFSLWGCKPNFITPVEKRIIGSWRLSPQRDDYEEIWTFKDNNQMHIVVNGDTTYFVLDPELGGKTVNYMEYAIQQGFTKVRMNMDSFFYDPSREADRKVPYFLFLELNKKEMYIYSIDNEIKGSRQFGFTKI